MSKTGFWFNVHKLHVLYSDSQPPTKKPYFETKSERHLEVLVILKRKGAMGDSVPDVLQSSSSLTHHSERSLLLPVLWISGRA